MNVHATGEPWPVAPRLPAREVDPIVLQIVEGTLNSIEAEIEYAIERTARSPMIREAHDYRVGLFDRYCRKLTGRSYSAMPNAVVRDFPPDTMQPGDVFLMNDTYLSEGSIGHLPDLCSTVPVFHRGEVVAYIQAFGHHDDIGGRVPGSMPGTAASVSMRGSPSPRSSSTAPSCARRRLHHRQAQHPCSPHARSRSRRRVRACVMGAGAWWSCSSGSTRDGGSLLQAILDKCRDIFRRCCRRSPTANITGKITSSTTASPIPSCTSRDHDDQEGRAHHPTTGPIRSPPVHQLACKLCWRRITDQMDRTDPAQSSPIRRARGGNPCQ
jgi:N-methylhydantoinase B